MTNHDTLAYAIATEAVRQIRAGAAPWNAILSTDVFATSSRSWPLPDFVLSDEGNNISVAAEFKPPDQSKREYLTGLGQVMAYSKDFDYGLLVLPEISNDSYRIADHVVSILQQPPCAHLPLGILVYNPSTIGPRNPGFNVALPLTRRTIAPTHKARLENSFYAKWREMSPNELSRFLEYLYEEKTRPSAIPGNIRDRAFDRLWTDIQAGRLYHWGGGVRHAGANTKTAVFKNYRNFISHIGWVESDGALTENGLEALHLCHIYGYNSNLFQEHLARTVLLAGKHLVLLNAINDFQQEYLDRNGLFPSENTWLNMLEQYLEDKGLLKRNLERAAAAVMHSPRGFLKAEKQLWKNLELLTPYGARVYHPNRGFVFNWGKITELLNI